jgi:hypothetical protein
MFLTITLKLLMPSRPRVWLTAIPVWGKYMDKPLNQNNGVDFRDIATRLGA